MLRLIPFLIPSRPLLSRCPAPSANPFATPFAPLSASPALAACAALGRRLLSDSDCDSPPSACKKKKSLQSITTLCWKQLIQMCTRHGAEDEGAPRPRSLSGAAAAEGAPRQRPAETVKKLPCPPKKEPRDKCPPCAPCKPCDDPDSCAVKDADHTPRACSELCCEPKHEPIRLPPWCKDGVVKRKLKQLQKCFEKDECIARRPLGPYNPPRGCPTDESEGYRAMMRQRKRDKKWLEKYWARERLLDKEWAKAKRYYGDKQRMRKGVSCKVKQHRIEQCGLSECDQPKPRK